MFLFKLETSSNYYGLTVRFSNVARQMSENKTSWKKLSHGRKLTRNLAGELVNALASDRGSRLGRTCRDGISQQSIEKVEWVTHHITRKVIVINKRSSSLLFFLNKKKELQLQTEGSWSNRLITRVFFFFFSLFLIIMHS